MVYAASQKEMLYRQLQAAWQKQTAQREKEKYQTWPALQHSHCAGARQILAAEGSKRGMGGGGDTW